jgi:hypothetical protein
MGFDALIRSGVALADKLTADLQPIVQYSSYTGQSGKGGSTYATAVPIHAIIEYGGFLRQTTDGKFIQTIAHITFLQSISINTKDRIVLPNGTTGPIADTKGVIDPTTNTGYVTEVWLGAPSGV